MERCRYGAVPVASATGGLRDTLQDVSAFAGAPRERGDALESAEAATAAAYEANAARLPTGNAFTFAPATAEALMGALRRAVRVLREHPVLWAEIQAAGMRQDLSWARRAEAYERLLARVAATPARGHE